MVSTNLHLDVQWVISHSRSGLCHQRFYSQRISATVQRVPDRMCIYGRAIPQKKDQVSYRRG